MKTRGLRVLVIFSFVAVALTFGIAPTAFAGTTVKVNGYEIDVKAQEPAVPPELEPVNDQNQEKIDRPSQTEPGPAPADAESPGARKYKKWIVQFNGPIRTEQKKALTDLGCRIGDYLPDFAFLVTMDSDTKKKVEKLSFINGIVRYKPAYKIDKRLKDESGAVKAEKGRKVKLYVRVDGADSQSLVLSEVHRKKGAVLNVSGDVMRVELAQEHVSQLSRIEEVLWVEEAVPVTVLNDTSKWVIQTYALNDTKIWDKGLHGEGEIVGIGDTGLDYDMPWFHDPTGAAIGPLHRKVAGYDVTYGDDYDGNFGHGTHVAGTVAGDRTPVDGLSTANGMAPKAKVFLQDLTFGEANSINVPSDLGLLFITTYNAGARLHTNSWGASVNQYESMSRSADRFMWQHPDFLALFANGNSGPSAGTVGVPANAKNVVSVGAAENGAAAENVAGFSSNGPTADGRIKPTVTAPGVSIISADSDGVRNSFNNTTIAYSGTSMATPTVAGAAALVRQYFLDGYWPSGSANPADSIEPSAALVKATLINSGQNMTGSYTDAPIPSTGQGWGRINLSNALTFTGDARALEIADHKAGLSTDGTWSRTYYAPADQPFKATLVWTDYPGIEGAAKALVNDLDLAVTAPDGTVYRGNVFVDGASVGGGTGDRKNVEEQVLITSPVKGTYTVTVTGYNVPFGPQPFALVLTGGSNITSKGFISLNKHRYNGSGIIAVSVGDRDLNLRSDAIEEVFVSLSSDTEPLGERLRLVETGPDTAFFLGSLPVGIGQAVADNGVLEAVEGDRVTATYQDADDGTGLPAIATADALIDLTPPVISSVAPGTIGETTASITWSTNEPADSTVNYGETTARGTVVSHARLVTEHTLLTLSGLKEATTYYYDVSSRDEAGNSASDDNSGGLYTVTTLSLPPTVTVYSSAGTQTYYDTTTIYGISLDPSGVASVSVNNAPASYRSSDGYYELSVSLNYGANTFTVAATDTLGNTGNMTITVTRLLPSDLVMTAVSGPTRGSAGQVIQVPNTVSNIGLGSSGRFLVGLYLSVDNIITEEDIRIGDWKVGGLAPGASASTTTNCTIPSGIEPGTYTIGAIADYYDYYDQYESDETNNSLVGNQILIEIADLAMTAVSGVPATGLTGQAITVTNTVSNTSTSVAAPDSVVGIFLSEDAVITVDDMFIGYRLVPGLAPTASSTDATAVTLPTAIPSGTYYVGAIVDFYDGARETDETNNVLRAENAIAITGPDIIMASVSGPGSARSGDVIEVSNTVTTSASGGSAPDFYVVLYLSTDPNITTGDIYIGLRWLPGLAPGASDTQATGVRIPAWVPPGTYYLGAIADNVVVWEGLEDWAYQEDNAKETDETNNIVAGNRITIAGPDLAVTGVSAPSTARTGATIYVGNTVTNSPEGGAAPQSTAAFYLSTDAVITSSDINLGYRLVPSLTAGASSAADTVLTMPDSLTPGTYYLGAIADYDNNVTESNETNNSLAGNQVTIIGPDLVMTAVSGPASAFSGVPISVSNTVTASAAGGAAPYFTVGVYLSPDAVITTSDRLIGSRSVSSLASGAANSDATTAAIPNSVTPGTYFLGAIADHDMRTYDSDRTNNSLAGSQVTVIGPDLTMSAVSGPSSGLTGGTITVGTTVAASATGGSVSSSFGIGIYLSTDAAIDASDVLIGYRSVGSLASGESSAAETAVTIPASIPGGTYYLGAIADNGGGIVESDETNNALAGNQITITGPDLVMASVSGPTIGTRGKTITVSNTVSASASGGNAPGFYVGIFLSSDPVITESDLRIGYRSVGGLAAGASSAVDTVVTIPTNLTPGVYYIGAIADNFWIPCFECDPTGYQVTESDETNNIVAGNLITIIPDLTMTLVSGPATGLIGGTVTVSNTVTASALGSGSSGFYVGIYLSTDSVITTADRLLTTRSVASLESGASSAADTIVTLPSNLAPGVYYLGAIADVYNMVKESIETNNALSGNQITVIGPDLVMTVVSGPASGISGSSIIVSNTVAATSSGGASPGFSVGIYLSPDSVITTTDILIGTRTVSSLASGASSAADTTITLPAVAPGTYHIGAIADHSNSVAEPDETNNALAGSQITITGPDLSMSTVSGPGTAARGGTITLSNTATNLGGVASPGFLVGLYLSTDSVITTSDILIGTRSIASLAAGASDGASTAVTIPVVIGWDDEGYEIYLPAGTYYLGAIADSANAIGEPSETNNALAGNQIVISP